MTKLKLQFDANQEFQKQAVDAIVDVFDGQPLKQSKFTVSVADGSLFGKNTELGYANKLDLIPEDLFKNVIKIQDRNHLKRSEGLLDADYGVPNFAIEMETGTGKTYVYTRTILELNNKYGFTKFIVVVPSVAIREGVNKSLDITKDHFEELYQGQKFNYFVYNSDRLTEVRNFATSDSIEIMVINIDAFRKGFEEDNKSNKNATRIHKEQDKLEGRRPIEFIRDTNPIVIIDEPQSVDNTEKSKEAIKALNPMCIVRYSATHRNTYNLMYRLGPIEAYENKLVKKIEVVAVEGIGSGPYMKLEKVQKAPNGSYSADVVLSVLDKKGEAKTKRVKINTGKRKSFFDVSGQNEIYRNYVVTNISIESGMEYIEFETGDILKLNQNTDDLEIKRTQIRSTIESHLEKELRLLDKNIKVLSLFFLDRVNNYREYLNEGGFKKGRYAQIFEEEYLKIIKLPKYNQLFVTEKSKQYALCEDVDKIHDGYFAQDKKGIFKESRGEGASQADESAYDLIMKDKETLLSFDTPLRFIFSHSALKEGWDNPNVFQICTLVESADTMTKRQKVGRGLRLPVNQSGERIFDDNINILTVVANESYHSFAENLQKEIEKDTNTKFGVVEERLFENILFEKEGKVGELGYEESKEICEYLREQGWVDKNGKVKDELRQIVAREESGEDALVLPMKFASIKKKIVEQIKTTLKRLPIVDSKKKEKVSINKQVFMSDDFVELWNRIKYKTVYHLDFDSKILVENCIHEVRKMPEIKSNAIVARWIDLEINKRGVTFNEPTMIRNYVRDKYDQKQLPDILRYVATYTGLKKRSIADILLRSQTIDAFYINPQEYMEQVIQIINIEKRKLIVDGIKYDKICDDVFYQQELFENEELIGYLKDNAIQVGKSVYSHVIYDSDIEMTFAERLENDADVKLYAKLPDWFKIETPLGDYNPDWAILLEKNGVEKLYFVIETKGSILSEDLRPIEQGKIECGQKHFEALGTGVKFEKVRSYEEWRSI